MRTLSSLYSGLLLSTLLVLGGCGYIPFSSGALQGTVTPPPSDWTNAADPSIIELETNPAEPYSVKLWVIGLGPAAYVHAGANRTTWVEHIESNPDVRLLVDNNLYELRATRVTSAEEFNTFSDAYESKYGNRPRNENVNEAYLFRLTARD
ncbi:MAG: hypothetical protein AAF993_07530 [Pseudomonadota bacterium]